MNEDLEKEFLEELEGVLPMEIGDIYACLAGFYQDKDLPISEIPLGKTGELVRRWVDERKLIRLTYLCPDETSGCYYFPANTKFRVEGDSNA